MNTTVLRLVGVGSFMSPILRNVNIQKEQLIRVDDDTAAKVSGLRRRSLDDNDVFHYYFREEKDTGQRVDLDFTNPKVIRAIASNADAQVIGRLAAGEQVGTGDDAPQSPSAVIETAADRLPEPDDTDGGSPVDSEDDDGEDDGEDGEDPQADDDDGEDEPSEEELAKAKAEQEAKAAEAAKEKAAAKAAKPAAKTAKPKAVAESKATPAPVKRQRSQRG